VRYLKRTPIVLSVVVALLAGASVAHAQTRWEVTPFAGYYIASDLYNSYSAINPGTSNVELKNSFMWGGRLTGNTYRGAVELAYTRTGSDVEMHKQATQPTGDVGHVDFDNYDLNFLAYEQTANPKVTPFASIGFGWAWTHPKINSTFSTADVKGNTLFNFNFGLGVKVQANPKMALRFEGRWRVTDTAVTTSSGYWCDPWGYCYSYATDWYNSGELTGGLSYSFK